MKFIKNFQGWEITSLFFFSLVFHILVLNELKIFNQLICPVPSTDGDFYIFISKFMDENLFLVSKEAYYYSPLYAHIVNFLMNIFSYNTFYLQIYNLLIGSTIPIAIYLILKELLKNNKISLFIGFLSAIFDEFILYDLTILKITTGIFFICWGLYFLVKLNEKYFLFLSGLFFGIASLIYANFLLFLIFISLYLYSKYKIKVLYFIITFSFIILITTIRNYIAVQDFIPITAIGGIHFYIGNNLKSIGIYTPIPGVRPSGFGHYFDGRKVAEKSLKRKLKPSEVSKFWKNKAIDEIKRKPEHFIKLIFLKLWYVFNYFDIPNNIDKNYIKKHTFIYKNFTVSFGILSLFGLIGFLLSLKEKEFIPVHIFFIIYTISIVLFFVNDRYRLPLSIPLLIYFGFLIKNILKNNLKKNLIIFLLILVFSIPVFSKIPPSKIDYSMQTLNFERISSYLCELNSKIETTEDKRLKSALLTEEAEIYIEAGGYEQAYYLLKKSIELNSNNLKAKIMMKNIKQNLLFLY